MSARARAISGVTVLAHRRDARFESNLPSRRVSGVKKDSDYKEIPDIGEEDVPETACDTLKTIFISPICLLLVCAPLGMASPSLGWGDSATFWLNFCAMIPLAKILGDATEELAACLKNDMLSGLLNATFGNAVEMIMTVCLLKKHQYLVVKATLIGSMLSNMLLVLGMSFFFGGIWGKKQRVGQRAQPKTEAQIDHPAGKEQQFNSLGAMTNTAMLILSSLVLVLVTIFDEVDDVSADNGPSQKEEMSRYMLPISHTCSILILSCYGAYIIFQLVTHAANMADADEDDGDSSALGMTKSLLLLGAATVIVSICSEFLTEALEGALEGSGLHKSFVGIILMPIVGNACEHAAAIRFAMQDKIGLSVGIAVGSSVQIALFVAPFSVIIGWMIGDDADGVNMTLNFGLLNVAVLTMSVVLILAVVVDGKSNWLEGFMLMIAYVIIAVLYWRLPDADYSDYAFDNGVGANVTGSGANASAFASAFFA